MDDNAVLGPVDPHIGQSPAASVLTVLERKEPRYVDDQTLISADVARKAINADGDLSVYGVLPPTDTHPPIGGIRATSRTARPWETCVIPRQRGTLWSKPKIPIIIK